MQVKGQSNGCVFTELLTYFCVKNGSVHHFVCKCFLQINSKISRRDDTKTGVIYHNTIISRFSKPIDCVLRISHAQRLDLPHLLLRISCGISVEMN